MVDAAGRVVYLRGINEPAMVRGSGPSLVAGGDACGEGWVVPDPAEWDAIAAAGFNSVRLGISWANLEPVAPTPDASGGLLHHWNEPYLAALDGIISRIRDRRLAVILDMHQEKWSPAVKNPVLAGEALCEGEGMPVWLYPQAVSGNLDADVLQCEFYIGIAQPGLPETLQEGLAAAWQMLATRYSGDPTVVGADIVNEPSPHSVCTPAQMDLTGFYDRVGGAVHRANPNLLVICEDNLYSSYLVVGPALLAPPTVPNWVFSWHFYPAGWTSGEPPLQAHLDQARLWHVPLWIGEFNPLVGPTSGAPPDWPSTFQHTMQFFTDNGLGWAFWNFSFLFVRTTPDARLVLIRGLQQGL